MTTPGPSEFSADTAGGSRMLGTNGLQEAVNALTAAVRTNTDALKSASSSAPGGSPMPVGGTGQSITYGSFPRMQSAFSSFMGSGAGNAANYATTPTGGSGNGQGGWGNPQATLQGAGSAMASGAQSMMSGGPSFSNRITMNQFASMSTLGMGAGNVGAQQAQMYRMAFGSYGSNLNALAQNAGDAAQMYSTLQGIGGNPNPFATSLGSAGFGATAGFGYANMGQLSGAQSAQAAAQLYSGQTSMAMRQLGYGITPRAGMGQANPMQMGQVIQGMLQRWYGKGSVNQNTLNAGLANNGRLQLNLQAAGLDPSTMGPAIQMYNKLFSQGVSATQAQTLLNDAAHNKNYNGQSAQKLLSSKYGIATSDLQKLNDTHAQQMSTTSGEMGGFDSALSAATTTIQKFDAVLNKVLGAGGGILGKMSGYGAGLGTMGAVGGTFGSIVGKGLGMLSGILGGASGTPASSGTSGTGRPGSSNSRASGAAATAIKDAESMIGRPYVWGGDNPTTGFDCSGLVEWAYGQAGIKLPRTSQAQWAALQRRSVPLDKVMAGDIVFSAGSDGTPGSPGHEALMISNNSIIEAPYTGANIRVRGYNPGEWQHAGRPSGNLNAGGVSTYPNPNGSGLASSTTGQGNAGGGGLGLSVGNYGSSSELQNVSSALLGGASTGRSGSFGTSSAGNGQGSAAAGMGVSTAGGGSSAANRALAKKMAAQMYGWTGSEWNALNSLWGTYESGFNNTAQNPGSTAYGIAQFLNSTWGSYGPKTSNPGLQIKYGLEYIHDRYRDPAHALQFELSHNPHWYADGTRNARGGYAVVGERGPELVSLSGGQQVVNANRTRDILSGQSAKPQNTGSVATIRDLYLAPTAQNRGQGQYAGKCEVNLNMPAGAIVVHTSGSPTDVSNNVRTIMQGITESMADNEMVQKIMAGVMG